MCLLENDPIAKLKSVQLSVKKNCQS